MPSGPWSGRPPPRTAPTPPSSSSTSSELTIEGLVLVGRVGRAHGLAGDVVIEVLTNVDDRFAAGAELATPGGSTLRIDAVKQHSGKTLIRFAGHAGRDAAEALRGTELWAPPLDDPDVLWAHDLIGATVIDAAGVERGEVVAVVDNPAADLLELADGTLVPSNFITDHDPDAARVTIDAPDGLFDL